MKLVDVDSERIVYKQNILQFFSLPNFLDVIVIQDESAQISTAAHKTKKRRASSNSDLLEDTKNSERFFQDLINEREKADESLRESLFDVRRSTLLTGT